MIEEINTMPDGTCRLIKSQYQNNTVQNFESQGSFGATGVVNVEKVDDIEILGGLEEGSSQRRKVFDENGVSPALQAAMGFGGENVPLVVDAVIGSMQENAMVGNAEYSPSLTEAMGKGGGQIPMVVERTEVEELGFIDKGTGKHQSNVVYDNEGLSPCICAALGVKQPPTMTVEQSRVVVQKCGDRDKEGSYSVHNYSNTIPANPMSDRGQMLVEQTCVAMRGRNPKNPSDGTPEAETFGTLTTDGSSSKHNNRVIKIKQATKQGFIECEIGVGMQFRLSYKPNTKGKGRKERADKPNSNDGEYP